MHKKGFCAKKWIKVGPNQGSKTMFLFKNMKSIAQNPARNLATRQPLPSPERAFFAFKAYFLYPNKSQYHT
jgi:hypothetical protein